MQNVVFTSSGEAILKSALARIPDSQLFVVVDENTRPIANLVLGSRMVPENHLTVIGAGESNKNIDSVVRIWQMLSREGAKRNAMVVCVGGGMPCDVTGFACSTFKRGMSWINVPTTLLSQVDASIGGKTGINFDNLKNEVGTFTQPTKVIVDPRWLKSLPLMEKYNGLAEMLKHALLSSDTLVKQVYAIRFDTISDAALLKQIRQSVAVKNDFVANDFFETGMRRALNFGHTVGHAVESLLMDSSSPFSHGESIAWGMVAETLLSVQKMGFPRAKFDTLFRFVSSNYRPYPSELSIDAILSRMLHDKKNMRLDGVNFTLLEDVGRYRVDNYCNLEEVSSMLQEMLQLTF